MKNKILILAVFALVLSLPSTYSFGNTARRGVQVSTEKEIKTNQFKNTGVDSQQTNNPARTDQQRMESQSDNIERDPTKWPKGPATDSLSGEKVED